MSDSVVSNEDDFTTPIEDIPPKQKTRLQFLKQGALTSL